MYAYRYRRSDGSNSSRTHASHTGRSGAMRVVAAPRPPLARMVNSAKPSTRATAMSAGAIARGGRRFVDDRARERVERRTAALDVDLDALPSR